MEPNKTIEKLEKSGIFRNWKNNNKKSYIVNVFAMTDSDKVIDWHIGYYKEDTGRIVSFVVNGDIEQMPESEVFREEGKVSPLIISNVKIDFNQAIANAIEFQKRKYPGDFPMKKIILLQNFEKHHIYNITFVTHTFKTLNIKVSSNDGRIISDKIHSIFDFNDKTIN
jgi:hypothetical protein